MDVFHIDMSSNSSRVEYNFCIAPAFTIQPIGRQVGSNNHALHVHGDRWQAGRRGGMGGGGHNTPTQCQTNYTLHKHKTTLAGGMFLFLIGDAS